jgi:GNAT superfamily N-acetyltransferase
MDDAAEVTRLAGELGYPVSEFAMAERLATLVAHECHHISVVAHESKLLGWIAVERRNTLESGERIEIVGLVVSRTIRRGGIGKLLIGDAERWAIEQGFRSIHVRSNVAREGSHPFYEGLGYQRKKTQHMYAKALLAKS